MVLAAVATALITYNLPCFNTNSLLLLLSPAVLLSPVTPDSNSVAPVTSVSALAAVRSACISYFIVVPDELPEFLLLFNGVIVLASGFVAVASSYTYQDTPFDVSINQVQCIHFVLSGINQVKSKTSPKAGISNVP